MPQPTRAAVVGSPISHSLSPVLHRAAYDDLGLSDISYERIELIEEEFAGFLHHARDSAEWIGLSVTMPLKHRGFELMDFIDPQAEVLGVINTILFGPLGLTGVNTDVYGIVQALKEANHQVFDRVAVIGAGATAISALAGLAQFDTKHIDFYARSLARTARLTKAFHDTGMEASINRIAPEPADFARALESYDVIINTTPGGTLDPLTKNFNFDRQRLLFEAAYADGKSSFAQAWEKISPVVYGERMLLHQGFEQVRLFTGQVPNLGVMDRALQVHLSGR